MALVSRAAAARRLAGPIIALTAFLALVPASAANLEYAVKANFLYKFAPFVTWPPQVLGNDDSPFRICVAGTDPFGTELDNAVRGQKIGTHPIAIRRLARPDGAAGCHILFVAGSRTQTPAAMLQAVGRQPVLTVTDQQQNAPGGVIRFVVRGGRVRFVIDRAVADRLGLSISSKLLDLAIAVEN